MNFILTFLLVVPLCMLDGHLITQGILSEFGFGFYQIALALILCAITGFSIGYTISKLINKD